ncbi:MAG TPA: cyclic pyranopterin monophosphate synthase MoaC [Candidatus Latescibacteria bacterium]|nr:cyclic pyranopterin monophosphate synthase MoaC [Candidatus Latescibacterota bacterium]|tara:strand:+ start:111 stop:587 length:477 start_codon:yes stop_codon:yes gene_type:complete
MKKLTHIREDGAVQMVDVTQKEATSREAVAAGEIRMSTETVDLIARGELPKGNVLETARLAGIMAAKRTSEIIPLCHPLGVTGIGISFEVSEDRISVEAVVRVPGKTGVEMEALLAASVSLLTIYDMCKAVDKGMAIGNVRLMWKTGGSSGDFVRHPE